MNRPVYPGVSHGSQGTHSQVSSSQVTNTQVTNSHVSNSHQPGNFRMRSHFIPIFVISTFKTHYSIEYLFRFPLSRRSFACLFNSTSYKLRSDQLTCDQLTRCASSRRCSRSTTSVPTARISATTSLSTATSIPITTRIPSQQPISTILIHSSVR